LCSDSDLFHWGLVHWGVNHWDLNYRGLNHWGVNHWCLNYWGLNYWNLFYRGLCDINCLYCSSCIGDGCHICDIGGVREIGDVSDIQICEGSDICYILGINQPHGEG